MFTEDMMITGTADVQTSTQPTDSGGDPNLQKRLIGCSLAIGGNLLISISLNLQKYTHMQNAESDSDVHYLRRPLWWLGLLLMGLGEVGNFSAYGFAPASLVAPLGSTTVIANMFIAIIFLKERLRPEDLFGCAFAIIGALLLVTFSSKGDVMLDANEIVSLLKELPFIIYVCIEVVALVVLLVLRYKFEFNQVVVLLCITSLLASFTVISAKASSSMLQLSVGGSMQLQHPVFWVMLVVMIVTAVTQVKFLNLAMKDYDSTTVVPTNFVLFTNSAILAGVIFYKEFWGLAVIDIVMFLFGCLLSFVAVYFITVGRTKQIRLPNNEVTPVRPATPQQTTPILGDILPGWLINTVNQSTVQPRRENYLSTHERTVDRIPIIRHHDTDTSSDEEAINNAATFATKQSRSYQNR